MKKYEIHSVEYVENQVSKRRVLEKFDTKRQAIDFVLECMTNEEIKEIAEDIGKPVEEIEIQVVKLNNNGEIEEILMGVEYDKD